MIKTTFSERQVDTLMLCLISRRNNIRDLIRITKVTAPYTSELQDVEQLMEQLRPGSVKIVRNMEAA